MIIIDKNISGHFFKDTALTSRIIREPFASEDFLVTPTSQISYLSSNSYSGIMIKDILLTNYTAASGNTYTNYPSTIALGTIFTNPIVYSSIPSVKYLPCDLSGPGIGTNT